MHTDIDRTRYGVDELPLAGALLVEQAAEDAEQQVACRSEVAQPAEVARKVTFVCMR